MPLPLMYRIRRQYDRPVVADVARKRSINWGNCHFWTK